MAAVGKHKHSKSRKGDRLASRKTTVPLGILCKNCNKIKLAHKVCLHCKK